MHSSKNKNKCYIFQVIIYKIMHSILKITAFNLILILLITGCEKETPAPFRFNGKELNKMINAYLAGDSAAYSLIGVLFNNANPKLIKLNELIIDSLTLPANQTLYSLLIESQNPVFNLFALIDKNMNVLLMDNSLNGNLTGSYHRIENRDLFILGESFKSKDTFNLKRTSLYQIKNNSVSLIFRALTGFSFGDIKINSTITAFDNDRVVLTFNSINATQFKEKTDEYLYDEISQRYTSEKNFLRNYAISEISKFKSKSGFNEIIDHNSFLRILYGRNSEPVLTKISNEDYSIELSDEWRQFDNFAVTQFLSNEFKGYKYINELIGSGISIVKLPLRDSLEVYSNVALSNRALYKHPVRFSQLIESGKYYYQLIEFNCNSTRILMIIETPKFTYEDNKDLLINIIQTFRVNC